MNWPDNQKQLSYVRKDGSHIYTCCSGTGGIIEETKGQQRRNAMEWIINVIREDYRNVRAIFDNQKP